MTAAAVIKDATADGVLLALSAAGTIKVSGDAAAVARWSPQIREAKQEIIDLIGQHKRKAWRWLIHFPDRNPLEVAFSPAATHGEVLDFYPDALAAEPVEDGAIEAGNDPPSLASEDDMHSCRECRNLRGAVCSIAQPGGVVSALTGYKPALPGMVQHCKGFVQRS